MGVGKTIIDALLGPVGTGLETALSPTELNKCEQEVIDARDDVFKEMEAHETQERLDVFEQHQREMDIREKYEREIQELKEQKEDVSRSENHRQETQRIEIDSSSVSNEGSNAGNGQDVGSGTGQIY